MILYNLHTDGDQYRITKFDDGNPVSSYLLTERECECPAGHRPTCRHRQMLPQMLNNGICNTPWFMDWDGKREGLILDFNGDPAVLAPATEPTTPQYGNGPITELLPEVAAYNATRPWRRI